MKRGQNFNVTSNTQTMFQTMVEKKIAKSAVLPPLSFYAAKDYMNKYLVNELATERNVEAQSVLQRQLTCLCDIFGVSTNQFVRNAQQLAMQKAELTCEIGELTELKTLLSYQREDEIDNESIALIDKMVGDIDFVLSIANPVVG